MGRGSREALEVIAEREASALQVRIRSLKSQLQRAETRLEKVGHWLGEVKPDVCPACGAPWADGHCSRRCDDQANDAEIIAWQRDIDLRDAKR